MFPMSVNVLIAIMNSGICNSLHDRPDPEARQDAGANCADVVTEYRAERALHALRMATAPHARVRRAGRVIDGPVAELVPGDENSRSARLKEAEIRERELGDREAARLILEELVVDPSDEQAARYMAQLCERMGRWDRARDLYLNLARTRDAKKRADALLSPQPPPQP